MGIELDGAAERIEGLAREKRWAEARETLAPMAAADVASVFAEVKEDLIPALYRLLPKELASEVFVEMEPEEQELLIRGFSDAELKEVMDELYMDDAVDLVEEMPATVVKRILRQTDPETRKGINEILKYPEDSAGSIMTTEFVDLKRDMTVAGAIERIRRTGVDKETINICYVTDPARRLLGIVSIRTLLLAGPEELVGDVMDTRVIRAATLEDKEDVAQTLSRYHLLALPVVDTEDRLVGIVTIDDAVDVMEEEATEDFEHMAAINPTGRPYLRAGVWETVKSRIPWLMLLMFSATFTGIVITAFEDSLAACSALIGFIPMLMDTGGNSGSQSSVAVIRGISLGEVDPGDALRVLWKELRVAAICGALLSCANFAKVLLVDRLLLGNSDVTAQVALVISLTLACTVVCAKLTGCLLPLLAEKLRLDPAVVASPFITTIVDVMSLLLYFSFARAILRL